MHRLGELDAEVDAELRAARLNEGDKIVEDEGLIAKLKALERAATPAPWEWRKHSMHGPPHDDSDDGIETRIIETDGGFYPPRADDRALIVAMRNALPSLLARIAELEAKLIDAGALHLADEQTVRNLERQLAAEREIWGKALRDERGVFEAKLAAVDCAGNALREAATRNLMRYEQAEAKLAASERALAQMRERVAGCVVDMQVCGGHPKYLATLAAPAPAPTVEADFRGLLASEEPVPASGAERERDAMRAEADAARASQRAVQAHADARVRAAVLAERERCAKIAEEETGGFEVRDRWEDGPEIAALIRSQPEPGGEGA